MGQDACLRSKSVNEVMAGQYGVQGSIDYFHPLLLFLPWTPIGTPRPLPLSDQQGA